MDFSSLPETFFEENPVELNEGLQFFQFEGAKIAFDFQPSLLPTQKLLILVNGYQRTRQDFRAFRKKLEKFAPHVATLALDNRYCGQTQVPDLNAELSVMQMARDVDALAQLVCKKLNLNTFSVLGISMGGMIAQQLASNCARVEHLILVSTTAGGKGRTWPPTIADPNALTYKDHYETLQSTQQHMQKYFGEKFLKTSPLLFEMLCKTMLKAKAEAGNSRQKDAEIQFYASSNFDIVSQLPNIKAKTLVISGTEDQIIPLENSSFLSNNIQAAKLFTYPEVGHLILIEEPEKFVQDVGQFIQ